MYWMTMYWMSWVSVSHFGRFEAMSLYHWSSQARRSALLVGSLSGYPDTEPTTGWLSVRVMWLRRPLWRSGWGAWLFSEVGLLIWRSAVQSITSAIWISTTVFNLPHHQRPVSLIPCLCGVGGKSVGSGFLLTNIFSEDENKTIQT